MRKVLSALFAGTLALALAACGGSSSGSGSGSGTMSTDGFDTYAVTTIDGASGETQTTITINEGEAYVLASNLESGTVTVILKQNGEEVSTDYEYEGYGLMEMEVSAGEYEIVFAAEDATGTIYALSYPTDQLDFMNPDSSTEDLFAEVEAYLAQ